MNITYINCNPLSANKLHTQHSPTIKEYASNVNLTKRRKCVTKWYIKLCIWVKPIVRNWKTRGLSGFFTITLTKHSILSDNQTINGINYNIVNNFLCF